MPSQPVYDDVEEAQELAVEAPAGSVISVLASSSSVLCELCVTGSTPLALSIFGSFTALCIFCPDTCEGAGGAAAPARLLARADGRLSRKSALSNGFTWARCVMNMEPSPFSPFPVAFPAGGMLAPSCGAITVGHPPTRSFFFFPLFLRCWIFQGMHSSCSPAATAQGGERNRRDGCAGSRVRLLPATARSACRWIALPALSLCWLACSEGADPVPTTSNRGLVRAERVPGRGGGGGCSGWVCVREREGERACRSCEIALGGPAQL